MGRAVVWSRAVLGAPVVRRALAVSVVLVARRVLAVSGALAVRWVLAVRDVPVFRPVLAVRCGAAVRAVCPAGPARLSGRGPRALSRARRRAA
ncbi:hypothetical protein ACWY4P_19335 [Streptomyces sp. LZ34]